MTDTAASIAADVISSLAADGLDARFILLKPGTPTGPEHNRTPGTPTEHTGTCVPINAQKAQRAGMTLEQGERVFTVFGLTVEPSTADKAKFYGGTDEWAVKQVMTQEFAEEAVSYMIKLAK